MSQLLSTAKSARTLLKEEGVVALFRRYRWKLVMAVFCYYLIRDLTFYVLLPLMIVKFF